MRRQSILGHLPLTHSGGSTLYHQIYERVRVSVLSGKLPQGTRLPSARTLSAELGVARGTVEMAYQLLASEGYTVARGARGTVVAPVPRLISRPAGSAEGRRRPAPTPAPPRTVTADPPLFQPSLPAMDAFPRKVWARLTARIARNQSWRDYAMQPAAGSQRLREAIARYLQISRGIECDTEQVMITAGFQGALGLIAHVLIEAGEAVWVEDPGYFAAHMALKRARAKLAPVPVDHHGIDVTAGIEKSPKARFALVTPSHQFPTGVALPINRRLALLQWASTSRAWVIEDDYDGEFHYRGRPLPALKSLDAADRVLYVGSFSKVLFPGLRMGYVVVPRALAEKFNAGCILLQPAAGSVEQAVVGEFIAQGNFARHIRKMRQLYAERRTALVDAIEQQCSDRLDIDLQAGGLHLLAHLRGRPHMAMLQKRAAALGVAFFPVSRTRVQSSGKLVLLLGFTNIPTSEAQRAAERLRNVLSVP